MTDVKFHILSGLRRSVSPSSHATEADGFVFLTGQFGRDLDDPAKPLARRHPGADRAEPAQHERVLAEPKRDRDN